MPIINWLNAHGTPYDYTSILHYHTFDFALDRSIPTIVPLKELGSLNILGGETPSSIDILDLALFYECPSGITLCGTADAQCTTGECCNTTLCVYRNTMSECSDGTLTNGNTIYCTGQSAYCPTIVLCNTQYEQCTGGECCDTELCVFKSQYTVCREETGLHDRAEYCTGNNENCPSDVPNKCTSCNITNHDIIKYCSNTIIQVPDRNINEEPTPITNTIHIGDIPMQLVGIYINYKHEWPSDLHISVYIDGQEYTLIQRYPSIENYIKCSSNTIQEFELYISNICYQIGNVYPSCAIFSAVKPFTPLPSTIYSNTIVFKVFDSSLGSVGQINNYCLFGYLSSDHTCRKASGECDVEERCTGDSGECPNDLVKLKTEQCDYSINHILKGNWCDGINKKCPTHCKTNKKIPQNQ